MCNICFTRSLSLLEGFSIQNIWLSIQQDKKDMWNKQMFHVLDVLKNIELNFWTKSFIVDIGSTTKQDLVPKSKEHGEKSNSLPRTEDR